MFLRDRTIMSFTRGMPARLQIRYEDFIRVLFDKPTTPSKSVEVAAAVARLGLGALDRFGRSVETPILQRVLHAQRWAIDFRLLNLSTFNEHHQYQSITMLEVR